MAVNSRKVCFPHVSHTRLASLIDAYQITMVISATYVVSTSFTKISILLFYKRMSDGAVSKGFRFAVRACIAFVVAYMITFLATLFLTCRPINSYWNQVSIPWALSHEEWVCRLIISHGDINLKIQGRRLPLLQRTSRLASCLRREYCPGFHSMRYADSPFLEAPASTKTKNRPWGCLWSRFLVRIWPFGVVLRLIKLVIVYALPEYYESSISP